LVHASHPFFLARYDQDENVSAKIETALYSKITGCKRSKLSLIMSGKQKPDIYFVKALHGKLNLDANQILKAV
jgi:HTH-type transcriptional regulator / antitoxin HigA